MLKKGRIDGGRHDGVDMYVLHAVQDQLLPQAHAQPPDGMLGDQGSVVDEDAAPLLQENR